MSVCWGMFFVCLSVYFFEVHITKIYNVTLHNNDYVFVKNVYKFVRVNERKYCIIFCVCLCVCVCLFTLK